MECLLYKNFPNQHFRRENIDVFWNVEDYPLPTSGSSGEEDVVDNARKSINNIISAFRQLGSLGEIGVIAFTKNPGVEGSLLMKCGVMNWYSADVGRLRNKMERYVVSFPRCEAGRRDEEIQYEDIEESSILVVVAKVGPEFRRVLKCLAERGQRIVLLPPEHDHFEFPDMSSVLQCGKRFGVRGCLKDVPMYDDERYGQQDFNHGDDPVVRAHPHECFFQDNVWCNDSD